MSLKMSLAAGALPRLLAGAVLNALCYTLRALIARARTGEVVTDALTASATSRFHMPITTILFDADGVVQGPSANRRAMWAEVLCGEVIEWRVEEVERRIT